MFLVKIGLVSILFLTAALAQSNNQGDDVDKMKALAFLEGKWEGDGTIHFPDGRSYPYLIDEYAEYKVDGAALYIDGVARVEAGGEMRIVGKGMGIFYFDKTKQSYWLHHWAQDGSTFETPFVVGNNTIEYEYNEPATNERLKVRIEVSEKIRWQGTVLRHEKGNWAVVREYKMKRANSN
jgi:hypothetical protein